MKLVVKIRHTPITLKFKLKDLLEDSAKQSMIALFQDDDQKNLLEALYLFLMNDCISHYQSSDTTEGVWLEENFVKKYYDPIEPQKSAIKFGNICWLTPDEIKTITDFYVKRVQEKNEKLEKLEKDFQKKNKNLDQQEGLGSEDRARLKEKLLKNHKEEIQRVEDSFEEKEQKEEQVEEEPPKPKKKLVTTK